MLMDDLKHTMDPDASQEPGPDVKDTGVVVDLDDAVLRAQGHVAELKRSFSWVGALGLAFRYGSVSTLCLCSPSTQHVHSIVNSWLTYAACFGVAFSYGGGSVAVFSPVISAIIQWITLLGVSELSSAFPSSGVSYSLMQNRYYTNRQCSIQGQYHFTYIITPESYKRVAAYIVGMVNILAWWINTASGTIYTAISVFGIITFLNPNFSGQQWQVYLCYLLIIFLTRGYSPSDKIRTINDACSSTNLPHSSEAY